MTNEDAQLFVRRLIENFVEAMSDYATAQTSLAAAQTAVEESNKRLTALTSIKNSSLQLPEISKAVSDLNAVWP